MPDVAMKNGWHMRRFDEMAGIVNDRIDDPSEADVDRYVGLEHLDADSLTIRRWGSPGDVEATKLRFRTGDIIFGRRRVYQRKLGVAGFDGICSAHAMVLRAKPAVALPEFLPFFMQSDLFMERAKEISVGSLSPTINWKTLAKEEFTLPPLEDQRRIHAVVATASSVIGHLSDSITSCEALLASIRASHFDPSRYKPIALAQLCDDGIQIGPFGAQLHQSDYQADGVPVVMPMNMSAGKIVTDGIARISEQKARFLAVHRIQQGDILLPRRGELDRRAYVDESATGWLCGTGSVRVRVHSRVLSLAVFHALASPHGVRWLNANAVGTTMPNLNTKIVGAVPIALPPANVLEAIVAELQGLDTGLMALRSRLVVAHGVRKRLLATALGMT
jgi:type I restriction enzyme S subunit